MAAGPTKNLKIKALAELVQRRCRGAGLTAPPKRTVLETLMYAALLENATFDKAGLAYTVLENYYVDWNEIRVCSVRELADTLTDLPHPEAAANRIRKALQGIFEKLYVFDLEELRKKGKAVTEHIKFLESMSAGTPYMIQYTAQIALDAHLIPLDEASLRIMRRLGLTHVTGNGTQEVCLGLDRVVLKKSGLTFAAQLHHFAAGYYDVPDDPELLSFLSKIDSEAVNRSWASPILTPPPSAPMPQSEVPPVPDRKVESPKETPAVKPPAVKPPAVKPPAVKPPAVKPSAPAKAAPVAKPKPAPKPAKPASKPVSKPVSKKTPPAKPAKQVTKKAVPSKPVPSKSKAKPVVKKGTAKPAKKPPGKALKGGSPSKSLRKKKPK